MGNKTLPAINVINSYIGLNPDQLTIDLGGNIFAATAGQIVNLFKQLIVEQIVG